MIRLSFYLFIFAANISVLSAQSIFDSTSSKQFAKWLWDNREYEEYIIEVNRQLKEFPNNDSLKSRLVEAYEVQGKNDSALYKHRELFPQKLSYPLLIKRLNLLILTNQKYELETILSNDSTLKENDKRKFLFSLTILKKDWRSALNMYNSSNYLFSDKYKNAPIIEKIKKPYKSPYIASAMSAIIPGSGKIYSNRTKDGIVSLLFVGLFSWQSYVGFDKKGGNSVYGWVNGGLASGFYLSGIYGAFKAAKKYNKAKDETIFNTLHFNHKYNLQ